MGVGLERRDTGEGPPGKSRLRFTGWGRSRVAEHETVRAIEIRRASLSSEVVLIIEPLLAKDRSAVNPKGCRAKGVAGCINRFGEGISRQDLKAMAQSLVDGCLQRVVVAVSAALDPKGNRLEPEKRDSFHRIGGRVGGQPIHRIGGTGKKRLIIAS